MDISEIIKNYDLNNLTVGVLGGHSALDVCRGAKKYGFKTVAVCRKGREKTFAKYYKSREEDGKELGCVDETILVDKFEDVLLPENQETLRKMNTIFIGSRYWWVYFSNFDKVENEFEVPFYGSRGLVKLEERDQPNNQYVLLEKAGIRIPNIIREGDSGMNDDELKTALDNHFVKEKGGPLLVKVNEAIRGYERAFFIITREREYFDISKKMLEEGKITQEDLDKAVIEEFVIGAQINYNFFYSPINDRLELMGTDTRRQTSLGGFLRLDAGTQQLLLDKGYKPTMIETGHIACTCKESLLEKAFEAGEKFVETMKKEVPPGMIGPFALQGAIGSYDGKEEFVVFDVSMRIPGSPGTPFTPYSGYLHGESVSYGERIAMELKSTIKKEKLIEVLS